MGASRRALLRAAAVAGLGLPVACTPATRPTPVPVPSGSAPPRRPGDPVTVAMHLHTSFSEGPASMATHLDQARRLGVDVLFWTDHDFRVSAQGYRRRLGLSGWTDTEGGVALTWKRRLEGAVGAADVVFADGGAVLTARAGAPEFATLWLDAEAWNSTYRGSLADTALEMQVRPLALGPDAHLRLGIDLSYHPASGGRPAGRYGLTYRIGPFPGGDRRADGRDGRDGVVEIAAAPGEWTTLTLRPVDDIRALWPDLVAEDNSAVTLRVGVAARRGATAGCAVRGLNLVRARRAGQESLALVREVMARYAERYPDRRQYQALEVSLVRHLNWFGGELVMPDYGTAAPVKDDAVPAAAAMVEFIHRHGGLASYNHPLYGPKDAVARHMVETRALGADVVEVAYGGAVPLASMLHVFDACARNLVFVTGSGVSDDHEGVDWFRNNRSNWITRLWADSVDLPDLMRALRAGRAWCYKPDGWSGALDVRLAGVPAMGGALVTAAPTVPVTVHAADLPAGGALEVVTGAADRAAAAPATTSAVVPAREVPGGGYGFDARAGTYVRAMVRDRAGAVVAVGNPVWVLPEAEAGDVPAHRRLAIG